MDAVERERLAPGWQKKSSWRLLRRSLAGAKLEKVRLRAGAYSRCAVMGLDTLVQQVSHKIYHIES